jgi:hypothetical protein
MTSLSGRMILLASIGVAVLLISSLAFMMTLPATPMESKRPSGPEAQVPRLEPPAGAPVDSPDKSAVNSSKFMKGEVVVGFKSGVDISSPEVADIIERNGGKIAMYNTQIRAVLVQVEAGKEQEFIKKISATDLVEYAELNPIANPAPVPQEPRDRPPLGGAIAPIVNPEQPPSNASEPIKGEVIVGFKPGIDIRSAEVSDLIERNGGKIARYNTQIRAVLVQVEAGKEQEFMKKISLSALVEYAELNRAANPAP